MNGYDKLHLALRSLTWNTKQNLEEKHFLTLNPFIYSGTSSVCPWEIFGTGKFSKCY